MLLLKSGEKLQYLPWLCGYRYLNILISLVGFLILALSFAHILTNLTRNVLNRPTTDVYLYNSETQRRKQKTSLF